MNLKNLFETQKILRDRINYQGEDRFEKLVLALLVEVGELANEQRSWKFWSTDQKPRTEAQRQGKTASGLPARHIETYNPLLEEYVDGFHFVLELGIEIGHTDIKATRYFVFGRKITSQFTQVMQSALHVQYQWVNKGSRVAINKEYEDLMYLYLGLGEMLGFTSEQIETAYYAKNKINHQRQESGY